ncbi:MAG: hypothetical protein DMG68_06295 [Acidobacteria bacterium]|nr:MAG: hypothetical protein DMG68_06295 [Acidobacteriota bacterium]
MRGLRFCYLIPGVELTRQEKNRKKLEPTSIARPAASTASIFSTDVIPVVPSAFGHSLWS